MRWQSPYRHPLAAWGLVTRPISEEDERDGHYDDVFPEEDDMADIIDDLAEDDSALPPPRARAPGSVARASGSVGPAEPRVVLAPAVAKAPRRDLSRIDHACGYLRMSQTLGKLHWDFRGVCSRHTNCTLTRHGDKPGIADTSPDGRPIGTLWHFLDSAAMFDSKEDHKNYIFKSSKADRLKSRLEFMQEDGAGAFLQEERPQRIRTGEGLEPDRVPGVGS